VGVSAALIMYRAARLEQRFLCGVRTQHREHLLSANSGAKRTRARSKHRRAGCRCMTPISCVSISPRLAKATAQHQRRAQIIDGWCGCHQGVTRRSRRKLSRHARALCWRLPRRQLETTAPPRRTGASRDNAVAAKKRCMNWRDIRRAGVTGDAAYLISWRAVPAPTE